jgi:hypothetical protein
LIRRGSSTKIATASSALWCTTRRCPTWKSKIRRRFNAPKQSYPIAGNGFGALNNHANQRDQSFFNHRNFPENAAV